MNRFCKCFSTFFPKYVSGAANVNKNNISLWPLGENTKNRQKRYTFTFICEKMTVQNTADTWLSGDFLSKFSGYIQDLKMFLSGGSKNILMQQIRQTPLPQK